MSERPATMADMRRFWLEKSEQELLEAAAVIAAAGGVMSVVTEERGKGAPVVVNSDWTDEGFGSWKRAPETKRIRFGAVKAGGGADQQDLVDVLVKAFTGEQLRGLHQAAASLPESVNGRGGLDARAVHGEDWARLVDALGVAAHLTRKPAAGEQVTVSSARDDLEPYQVFLAGMDTPLTVLVQPQGYRSTMVPAGAGFEATVTVAEGQQAELLLVPAHDKPAISRP